MAIRHRRHCLLTLLTFALAAYSSCADPMEHAHCEDTEIKRVKSPSGNLVAVVYNRSCSNGTGLYTYAEIEDPSEVIFWPSNRHPEVCFLVTLANGYHQLDVAWKDDKHIELSSSDEIDRDRDISSQYTKCNDIEVTYKFKFAPPPLDEAPDKETVDAISAAISETQNCFDGGSHPERTERLKSMMDADDHGDALEWLCTYLKQGHCPVSSKSLVLIQQAAAKMGRTKMSCDRLGEALSH